MLSAGGGQVTRWPVRLVVAYDWCVTASLAGRAVFLFSDILLESPTNSKTILRDENEAWCGWPSPGQEATMPPLQLRRQRMHCSRKRWSGETPCLVVSSWPTSYSAWHRRWQLPSWPRSVLQKGAKLLQPGHLNCIYLSKSATKIGGLLPKFANCHLAKSRFRGSILSDCSSWGL